MINDLKERLLNRQVCSPAQNSCRNDWLCEQAYARIEELEAKLAKLARAAKPFAAIKIKDGRSQAGEIGRTDVTNIRAALAELKGEK